jgi:formylglycine-generating enzyme required for sulfatase activity
MFLTPGLRRDDAPCSPKEEPTMKRTLCAVGLSAFCLAWTAPAFAGTLKCPADSVKVGNACIDKYEASIWQIAPSNTALGCTASPFNQTAYPANFPNDGNWTPVADSSPPSPGVYAVSIPGVLPSTCTTWFQAVQACAVSGKRLARNEEWQRAAAGTPDPGTDNGTTDCNISTAGHPVNTGSRSSCKSSWGVFDMVGNATEWVADWADLSTGCTDWTSQTGIAGGDFSCFGGPGTTGASGETSNFNSIPGALIRGGSWRLGTGAGVFAVHTNGNPSVSNFLVGFRCAR